ncbi:hypothetical protein FRC19_008381 [Serendipita sp. 401]|nr:hypothetical protein FRC19_008381 [Serendipita sp. 401]KAG9058758.1 hypothetical protein FS842_003547 [Serendipita sp. 407]
MATPNPARLSALGSKTLTLAMERQRLLSISPPSSSSPLRPAGANPGGSVGQITKNLTALREGIINIENSQGPSKQTQALREQYQSVLGILGEDEVSAAGIESLPVPPQRRVEPLIPSATASSLQQQGTTFKDDPQETNEDMYMQQTQIMRDQDTQLESLSQSIGRQHHLSLQINDELGEQAGLLEGLDEDLDRTGARLARAQRTMNKVSKGAKENWSTLTIGIIILVLLLLIIIFKT